MIQRPWRSTPYDGVNRRIVKKSYTAGVLDETRHAYFSDQWQTLEERVGSTTTADRQFVWGMRYVDDLVLRDQDVERLYVLQDALFNVVAITGDTGTVKERFAYQPYGESVELDPDFSTYSGVDYDWEYRFTGRELDLETGLQVNRNRYLHLELSRWASRDPIGFHSTDSNLYRYVSSSPLSFLDPDGLERTNKPCSGLLPCLFDGECCRDTVRFELDAGSQLGTLTWVAKLFGFESLKARFEMQRDSCCEECDPCPELKRSRQKLTLAWTLEAAYNSNQFEKFGVVFQAGWYFRAGSAGGISAELSACDGISGGGCGQISAELGASAQAKVRGRLGGGGRLGINVTGSACLECTPDGCEVYSQVCVSLRARIWASYQFGRKWEWYRQWSSPKLCTPQATLFGTGGGGDNDPIL